jgi:hypothetical protein
VSTRHRSVYVTLAAVAAALFAALAAWPGFATAADDPTSKIEPGLEPSKGFWVVFGEETDLAGAASIKDWDRRGEAVVDELKDTAKDSQGAVRRAAGGRRRVRPVLPRERDPRVRRLGGPRT